MLWNSSRCGEHVHKWYRLQKIEKFNQKEPLKTEIVPERPYNFVSADLFYSGLKFFMIFKDQLLGLPLVAIQSKDLTSRQVKKWLIQYFYSSKNYWSSSQRKDNNSVVKKCNIFWKKMVPSIGNHLRTTLKVLVTKKETQKLW